MFLFEIFFFSFVLVLMRRSSDYRELVSRLSNDVENPDDQWNTDI